MIGWLKCMSWKCSLLVSVVELLFCLYMYVIFVLVSRLVVVLNDVLCNSW